MDKSEPIRAIVHCEDGDWMFLCDTTQDPSDGQIVCLGCLMEAFPFIAEHAALPLGFEAVRTGEGTTWVTLPILWEDSSVE